MHTVDFIGIVPARYASSRFPGKPLAGIKGKSMIQHVYERAKVNLDKVYVATDDKRIYKEVERFGGKAIMTSPEHRSGTDRCAEALHILEQKKDERPEIVINIQGDEPFFGHDYINTLKLCFEDNSTGIATLINPVHDLETLRNPNRVKVVIDKNGFALYFSRSVIPFLRDMRSDRWIKHHKYYQHIGMYAYRADILKKIVQLRESILERAESLEQLRWLENGYRIKTAVTDCESLSIDTPEDLENLSGMRK